MEPSPDSLLKTGIEREIEDLYQQEAGSLLRYAAALAENRETAHDAVQETFFRFFLFRSAGQPIRSPRGWLFRVARNYVLDQMRAGARREVGVESLRNLPVSSEETGSDGPVWELLQGLALAGLSPREMECIRLRMEDLRYEEIGVVMGLRSGTVGALLARAHDKIRKAVGARPQNSRDDAPRVAGEEGYAS